MKNITKHLKLLYLAVCSILLIQCKKTDVSVPEISKETLGKTIFLDETLSNPEGQSCGSCHLQSTAFTDPSHSNVSPGAVDGLFGNRNAPTIKYAMFAPPLHFGTNDSVYTGGLFWDGRVNSLEEQAKKPFFNPVEMNNTDVNMLASRIKKSAFYTAFVQLFGETSDAEIMLDNAADAIAAFERSTEVNPFTSKYDFYLSKKASLTSLEYEGLQLFKDTAKAKCANCHSIDPDPVSGKVLFTDFTYDNIGVPKNQYNPYYNIPSSYNPEGYFFIDYGLAGTTHSADNNGQFKVPTLRNIALTGPYFHNGVFGTLEEVVHFYNKRDVDHTIAPPEVPENVNTTELGDLKLTDAEEKAIVAYLKTLTDGYDSP